MANPDPFRRGRGTMWGSARRRRPPHRRRASLPRRPPPALRLRRRLPPDGRPGDPVTRGMSSVATGPWTWPITPLSATPAASPIRRCRGGQKHPACRALRASRATRCLRRPCRNRHRSGRPDRAGSPGTNPPELAPPRVAAVTRKPSSPATTLVIQAMMIPPPRDDRRVPSRPAPARVARLRAW